MKLNLASNRFISVVNYDFVLYQSVANSDLGKVDK